MGRSKEPSLGCLRQRVGADLRRMIISGQLKPGQRIAQFPLAQQLGVSQSVVREALLELQFTGLVESVENLGMFVATIDPKKVLQAYNVREMLEGLAARACCETCSVADIRELTAIVERVYALAMGGKDQERADQDRHFHDRIFEISGNMVLKRVAGAYHIVRLVVLKDIAHDQVRADHLAIVSAIERNAPDEAERFARLHVSKARERIEKQISSNALEFAIGGDKRAPEVISA